jgi:hypothetical protein
MHPLVQIFFVLQAQPFVAPLEVAGVENGSEEPELASAVHPAESSVF